MAKIPSIDPGSTEIQSPFIAGLSDGISKLSSILDMGVSQLTDYALQNVPSDNDVTSRIFQAKNGQRLWLVEPTPVIKKNGTIITPDTDFFTIDYVGGSITFEEKHILDPNDTVTVSCSYIADASNTINNILTAINDVTKIAEHYKGAYATATELSSNNPTGENGDYAIVLSTGSVFVWKDTAWKNSQSIEDLTNYYTKTETNDLLDTKEPNIAEKSGSNPQDFYYSGNKTWLDVNFKVRSTTLTDLVTTNNSAITQNDNILSGLGKLQAQIDNKESYIKANSEPTTATVGKIGQRYVNTSNGNWYILTSITEDGSYIWSDYYNKQQTDAKINATLGRPVTILVPASGWQGNTAGPWTNAVAVEGITALTELSNILPAATSSEDAQQAALQWQMLDTGPGTVTFTATEEKPTVDFTLTAIARETKGADEDASE